MLFNLMIYEGDYLNGETNEKGKKYEKTYNLFKKL